MKQLLNQLTTNYHKFFADKTTFTIGLSGGMDSVLLLNLFAQLRLMLPIQVNAVHVNHGISINADAWQNFCKKICQQLDIPLDVSCHKVARLGGESLENNARKVRYAVFKDYGASVIVLAHHQNDQIETLVSQMMRGSDIHNLASMSEIATKNQQLYWRPLLHTPRNVIEELVQNYKLDYVHDESNADTSYLRNFVRHQLVPKMLDWDKEVLTKLANVVKQLQQTAELVDEIAIDDFHRVCADRKTMYLDVTLFNELSPLRQINLLSYYIHLHQIGLPSRKRLSEFAHQVSSAKPDRHPCLLLDGGFMLLRNKNFIVMHAHYAN